MSPWQELLRKPDAFADGPVADGWFARIADRLLNGSRLVVGKEEHRFAEVEVYYCGDGHPDPFTHRDPVQLENGRWYFHRTRGVYRGGSFKGLDLAFGDGRAFAGVLIRTIEAPADVLIDGPSLCVDHLLSRAGAKTVAALDAAIAGRPAWDPNSPLILRAVEGGEPRPVFRSARVGLSLKKAGPSGDAARYVVRPYRFLTEPRRIGKGKLHLVLALHSQGVGPERIREITRCPPASIRRYLDDFEAGRWEADLTPFVGIDLGPKELCRLHGAWQAKYGPPVKRTNTLF